MLKVEKITNLMSIESNVQAQGDDCDNDCEVVVWAGKKEADGWKAGCWSTKQYTARWNPFS